jgi:hypothetical protein
MAPAPRDAWPSAADVRHHARADAREVDTRARLVGEAKREAQALRRAVVRGSVAAVVLAIAAVVAAEALPYLALNLAAAAER